MRHTVFRLSQVSVSRRHKVGTQSYSLCKTVSLRDTPSLSVSDSQSLSVSETAESQSVSEIVKDYHFQDRNRLPKDC